MKLAFMCLIVFVSGLFATEASSQTERVSIVAYSISTKDLIREIEKQTEYLFVYNKNALTFAAGLKQKLLIMLLITYIY